MTTHWSNAYVGIPFADGGREREQGLDCWGLVRLVFREVRAIELPTYGEVSAEDLKAIALKVKEEREHWLSVAGRPRDFDVVLMTGRRVRNVDGAKPARADIHVGLIVDASEMCVLHADLNAHSVCVPLTHDSVRFRIQSYLRHHALA